MQRMRDQAQNVGVQMIDDTITEIDFEHRPFVCSSENANSFVGDSLIIATGASARWLGLPSEEKFRGFGVSACATATAFFTATATSPLSAAAIPHWKRRSI